VNSRQKKVKKKSIGAVDMLLVDEQKEPLGVPSNPKLPMIL